MQFQRVCLFSFLEHQTWAGVRLNSLKYIFWILHVNMIKESGPEKST